MTKFLLLYYFSDAERLAAVLFVYYLIPIYIFKHYNYIHMFINPGDLYNFTQNYIFAG